MSKICPRCKGPHDKKGLYCSYSCANVREHTLDSKKKVSDGVKKHWESLPEDQKQEHREHAKKLGKIKSDKSFLEVLSEDFDTLSYNRKRWRILLEQNYKCNKCSLDEWCGLPITLELEHKDGNHKNNARENLECLCPNCHSLTPTWRGRNNDKDKKNWRDKINTNRICSSSLMVERALDKGET